MQFLALTSLLLSAAITPALAILNGTNVTLDHYEYTVAIMQPALSAYESSSVPFICNGVLITEYTVMTSAECVQGTDAASLNIRVGFPPDTIQTIGVNNITTMKTFNYTSLAGDIALLNLTDPVTNVTPAALASPTFEGQYPSGEVKLVGWGGMTNGTQEIAPHLQVANVDIIRPQTCRAALDTCGFKLNRKQRFCTSSDENGAEGYGDAGGPIVDGMGVVVGLMTGNPACAQPNNLAIQLLLSNAKINSFIQTNKFGLS